ncbi:MAG: glycosyltransferase [Alphaproteobacteria bacterium]|nr:glycosyltransferase [Alphaproteobacteria bacterium]
MVGENLRKPEIAVLLPCYNEAAAIASVVEDFKDALPDARIFVYDNASTDGTFDVARKAGANVFVEPRKGKGNVVRRMFADIEADIYILADGDGTYDATVAPEMVSHLVDDNLDMVVAARVDTGAHQGRDTYRPGHRMGNWLFTSTIAFLFGRQFTDILSGYRVFSRRFVKSIPINAEGFEIETEMTVHSLTLKLPVGEISAPYGVRPEGSVSKLNSYRDGFRILGTIIKLLKEARPFAFFLSISLVLAAASGILSIPLFITFLETGLVPRFPTAILAVGIMVVGFICLACGLILDTVSQNRRDLNGLRYLSLPSVRESLENPKGE